MNIDINNLLTEVIDPIYDEDGEMDYNKTEQLYDIARSRGMGITRDREPFIVSTDDNNKVNGGIFTSFEDNNYEFDVVMSVEAEGNGIGNQLLDIAIDNFSYYTEAYPDATMQIHVINPIMKKMLERRGFTVINNISNTEWIMEIV